MTGFASKHRYVCRGDGAGRMFSHQDWPCDRGLIWRPDASARRERTVAQKKPSVAGINVSPRESLSTSDYPERAVTPKKIERRGNKCLASRVIYFFVTTLTSSRVSEMTKM